MKTTQLASIIRWTARILGSLILAFVLFFLVADVIGDESSNGFQSTSELISFICFPITLVLGLAVAFRWEGLGGIISVLGMIGLFSIRPDLLSSPQFLLFMVPGLLYISYFFLSKKESYP